MTGPWLSGMLRRIRRSADLSQRELADQLGISKSAVAAAESGSSGLDVRVLLRAVEVAGLRLTVLDTAGREVDGMDGDAVRDEAGRHYPAHLDTRHGDEDWWHDEHRYSRQRVWYTFDRDRRTRDAVRRVQGVPEDHQRPQPGDSPRARAETRRASHWRAVAAERQRRFLAGEFAHVDQGVVCTCPPECDEVDDGSGPPRHAGACACRCDVC